MAVDSGGPEGAKRLTIREWAGMVLVYLLIPLTLFLCAGDPGWWQAWVYSAVIFVAGVGGRVLAERRHPGLMAERVRVAGADGVKPWDRILSPLMSITVGFPHMIVAGLDHRFGWTAPFPAWLEVAGLVLTACGYSFAVWALAENRFFSGMVRIQLDRGHVVCDTGPYRIVRHPGYAGNILSLPGIALALDSAWALIPAAVAVAVTVTRTELEDRTLRKELPGYAEYSRRVRFRLLPGIY